MPGSTIQPDASHTKFIKTWLPFQNMFTVVLISKHINYYYFDKLCTINLKVWGKPKRWMESGSRCPCKPATNRDMSDAALEIRLVRCLLTLLI